MRKSMNVIKCGLCVVLVNAILLAGCGVDSDKKEGSIDVSEPEAATVEESIQQPSNMETETGTEESGIAAAVMETEEKEDTHNLEILQKMKELNENGEYLEAVKAVRDMDKDGELSPKVIALRNEIIRGNEEYFATQVDAAFENRDYFLIETLMNFFEIDKEQRSEYNFVKKMQGEYVPLDKPDSDICVVIDGYEIQENDEKTMFSYKKVKPFEGIDYVEGRLSMDNGAEVEEVNVGVIAITHENGTVMKYVSALGLENLDRIEAREREEKESERQEEREYLANEPSIGMTKDEVKRSNWGSPKEINKTTYAWGVTEQWVYSGNRYIYFEEGVVTAISE